MRLDNRQLGIADLGKSYTIHQRHRSIPQRSKPLRLGEEWFYDLKSKSNFQIAANVGH